MKNNTEKIFLASSCFKSLFFGVVVFMLVFCSRYFFTSCSTPNWCQTVKLNLFDYIMLRCCRHLFPLLPVITVLKMRFMEVCQLEAPRRHCERCVVLNVTVIRGEETYLHDNAGSLRSWINNSITKV